MGGSGVGRPGWECGRTPKRERQQLQEEGLGETKAHRLEVRMSAASVQFRMSEGQEGAGRTSTRETRGPSQEWAERWCWTTRRERVERIAIKSKDAVMSARCGLQRSTVDYARRWCQWQSDQSAQPDQCNGVSHGTSAAHSERYQQHGQREGQDPDEACARAADAARAGQPSVVAKCHRCHTRCTYVKFLTGNCTINCFWKVCWRTQPFEPVEMICIARLHGFFDLDVRAMPRVTRGLQQTRLPLLGRSTAKPTCEVLRRTWVSSRSLSA